MASIVKKWPSCAKSLQRLNIRADAQVFSLNKAEYVHNYIVDARLKFWIIFSRVLRSELSKRAVIYAKCSLLTLRESL